MTTVAIRQAIADGVNEVLAEQVATNARKGGTDMQAGGTVTPAPRQCTYKDFRGCQPTYFKGTEGVTELAQWFERLETVFPRIGYTENNKVTFATGTLVQDALSWWNATS